MPTEIRPPCFIVPPHLLEAIASASDADVEPDVRKSAQKTLDHDMQSLRIFSNNANVKVSAPTIKTSAQKPGHLWREIYDAKQVDDTDNLPGVLLCAEGEDQEAKASEDDALQTTYENFKHIFDFFHQVFGYDSLNGRGLPLIANIHYGANYDNAFWAPNLRQMIFGDGGTYLRNFFSLDVMAHEVTHGVTQFTAALEYSGQSGALNESISDVFASMVKQYVMNQDAIEGDWLIGDDCLLPDVKGLALRSLKDPGRAYDKLGFAKDPQPPSMKTYVETNQDNGGVHINSSIPNRAFYLLATKLGGKSWDQAGRIWFSALTDKRIKPNCNFRQFADLTYDIAGKTFGTKVQSAVTSAWTEVGVYEGMDFRVVYQNPPYVVGVSNFDLISSRDRAIAFDYDSSGVVDHLLFYRPKNGTISILKDTGTGSDFTPVYATEDSGIGGYDLASENDRIFAFDYESTGKLDHLVIFRPGEGKLVVLKRAPDWSQVYASQPGKGIGDCDLLSTADRGFAFDWEHSGKLDHLVFYRPGIGRLWILKNASGVFSTVFAASQGSNDLAGFELTSPRARVLAFDYEHIGKQDHVVLYQPGDGKISILSNRNKKFVKVFESKAPDYGIGGYDLQSAVDQVFAYDLEGTGRLEYLVLYRPGRGEFCVLRNQKGVFAPAYHETSAGVAGFDLSSPVDRMITFQSPSLGRAGMLAFYRPGQGLFRTAQPVAMVE